MAFNIQTLKTRALTAIVFVAVMLTGLLWNYWSFLILFSIIHFGCWIEYQKLVGLIDNEYQEISLLHKYLIIIAGFSFMLWMTNDAYVIAGIRLHEIGWWMLLVTVCVFPIVEVLFTKSFKAKALAYSIAGLIYISLSWGLMLQLRGEGMVFKDRILILDMGFVLPVILIASIWINDTMAYIVGSFIGKTSLSPISPKKTWEGTIGGAILCIVTVTLVCHYWFDFPMLGGVGISSIAAVIGTLGDLLESKLKRLAGVKDSGNLMPGHGGFLDRFDSLILATPFAWLFVHFFAR